MNDNERYKIMMESRFILEKLGKYYSIIDFYTSNEEEKKERLPETLVSSRGVEESYESLNSLKECLENTTTTIEDTLFELNIKMRKPRERKIDATLLEAPSKLEKSKENRSVRLQFLVTPSTEAKLKAYCKKRNLAMNEVINRMIQGLEDD